MGKEMGLCQEQFCLTVDRLTRSREARQKNLSSDPNAEARSKNANVLSGQWLCILNRKTGTSLPERVGGSQPDFYRMEVQKRDVSTWQIFIHQNPEFPAGVTWN